VLRRGKKRRKATKIVMNTNKVVTNRKIEENREIFVQILHKSRNSKIAYEVTRLY
jgi:hypothetical protein